LWVFGLLCFVVAFAREAASGAGISLPGPKTRGARIGIALVGVLALGLGAAIRPRGGGPGPIVTLPTVTSTGPTPTTAAGSSGPPPSTAPGSSASSSAAGLTQLWSGAVSIPLNGSLDLDQTPPTGSDGGLGISSTHFATTTVTLTDTVVAPHAQLSVWTAASPPSPQQCADWATTHPDQEANVAIGKLVCLRTPGERTVLLKIDAIHTDEYTVDATATIWSN